MINSLYNFTAKGFLKALSFIFALGLFISILLKSTLFAEYFGGKVPYLALLVFYGMIILWIHGIGFEIQQKRWQLLFLPLVGYIIVLSALLCLWI